MGRRPEAIVMAMPEFRLLTGTDRAVAPEQRQRRLAAIFFIDVVEYCALMGRDEQTTHQRWMTMRKEVIEPTARTFGSRFMKSTGDGLLIEFESGLDAVKFALDLQRKFAGPTEGLEGALPVRMSVHLGDVMVESDDIYGDGVNIAARLLGFGDSGNIVVSSTVHDQVYQVGHYQAVDLGLLTLKNIDRRIRAFKIGHPDMAAPQPLAAHHYQPTIAVLPFHWFGPNEKRHYSEGMVLDIVASLAGLKELFVISSPSTLSFSQAAVDSSTISKQLGARYLVMGKIVCEHERIRISAELSDVEARSVLWTDRYEIPMADIFRIQDAIAEKIAYSLLPHIRNSELQRALRKAPQSLESYDYLLQAVYRMYKLTEEDSNLAKQFLEKAIERDPQYALAYAYLAKWYILHIGEGRSTDMQSDSREALRLSSLALDHNPSDPLALAVFGHASSFLFADYDKALYAFDRAIAACPSSAIAWGWSASTYCYLGDGPTAIARATHALALSPLDPFAYFYMSALTNAHYTNGTFDDAVHWGRKTMISAPRFVANLRLLIVSLVGAKRMEEARDVAASLIKNNPDFRVDAFVRWYPLKDPERRALFAERLTAAGLPR
jgi:adenylate cyclase